MQKKSILIPIVSSVYLIVSPPAFPQFDTVPTKDPINNFLKQKEAKGIIERHRDAIQSNSTVTSWLRVEPVSQLSLRTYYFSTDHPFDRFVLFNSDGDVLDRSWNPFLDVEGRGDAVSRFFFSYKVQARRPGRVVLKRLSLMLKTDDVSLEAGRGAIWIGHGYHGSLLLSNNAEPYSLIKFQTERTIRLPYIGGFRYMIFNGWPQNFKILGHRFSWLPWPWLQIAGNQTVAYKENFKLWEFPKVLSAAEENVPGRFDNDQRASIDVELYLPFLSDMLPALQDAKIYYEYAGEDLGAWWQGEDKVWVGLVGFQFLDIGRMYGIWLSTGDNELRVEYARNYILKGPFFDLSRDLRSSGFSRKWYRKVPFVNQGSIMGHHMGNGADDLFIEITHKWRGSSLRFFYDSERHGLVNPSLLPEETPEKLSQYGLEYSRSFEALEVTTLLMWNDYRNPDTDPDPLELRPIPATGADDFIVGVTLTYRFGSE
ncbi:MAG: capsule assembly Wzi family protein [Thermodesulfobacteriota bacterium]